MTQFLRSCVQILVDHKAWIRLRVIGLSAARSAMQAVSVEVTGELVAEILKYFRTKTRESCSSTWNPLRANWSDDCA